MARPLSCEDYTVGWVCALPIELAAAQEMIDEEHKTPQYDTAKDNNIYTCGRVSEHNVVIACLPKGQTGTNSAAAVAAQMKSTFTSTRIGLMVGIGGGVPSVEDVRLGDVVVSNPLNAYGGVVQYDFGKATPSGFERTGFLNTPPKILLNAIANLQATHIRKRSRLMEYISKLESDSVFGREAAGVDVLFKASYDHVEGATCSKCSTEHIVVRKEPRQVHVHYGTIASGNQVMRDATQRDRVSADLGGVLCFEMEAAGLMNSFPCLVIRGICDYADSHKNKQWQAYAALTAAAYAKEVLSVIPATDIAKTHTVEEAIRESVGPSNEVKGPSQERAIAPPLDVRSQHITAIKNGNPNIPCETCGKKFHTRSAVDDHMTVVGHKKPKIPCETCGKKFHTRSAADDHMAAVGHKKPKIPCKTCPKKFHTQNAATAHMIAVRH